MDRSVVQDVALLARLKLSDEELDRFSGQLGKILEYVGVLDEVDVSNVKPMAHAVEQSNVLRDDEVRESLPREAALANAPKTDGQFFMVPQILDGT